MYIFLVYLVFLGSSLTNNHFSHGLEDDIKYIQATLVDDMQIDPSKWWSLILTRFSSGASCALQLFAVKSNSTADESCVSRAGLLFHASDCLCRKWFSHLFLLMGEQYRELKQCQYIKIYSLKV